MERSHAARQEEKMSSFTTLKKMTTESRGMSEMRKLGSCLSSATRMSFGPYANLSPLATSFLIISVRTKVPNTISTTTPTRPPTRPAAGPSPTTCMDSTFTSCAVPGPVSAKA